LTVFLTVFWAEFSIKMPDRARTAPLTVFFYANILIKLSISEISARRISDGTLNIDGYWPVGDSRLSGVKQRERTFRENQDRSLSRISRF